MKHSSSRERCRFLPMLAALFSLGLTGHAVSQSEAKDPVLDVNHLDRFAWELFVRLNLPAGGANRNVAWEAWASTDDVFSNPDQAPVWPEEVPETKRLSPTLKQQESFREFMRQRLAPGTAVPEFHPSGIGGNEVRLNRAAFDYIVANDLYNLDGQEKAFAENKKIDFPCRRRRSRRAGKRSGRPTSLAIIGNPIKGRSTA